MFTNEPAIPPVPQHRGKIANTWHLTKISWSVLRKDRELLIMPALSLFFIIIVAICAALVMHTLESTSSAETAENTMAVVGVVAAMVAGIISVFFQGAVVAGAYERMTGGDPTVGSALQVAVNRISGLVPWAIITTTVGIVLRAMKNNRDNNFLVRLLASVLETAWEVVTFLTVPAIIVDALGPIKALKRSAQLLRETWGENIIAHAGFGLLTFLLVAAGIVPLGLVGGLLYVLAGELGLIIAVVVAVAYVAVLVVFLTALNAVYQTALYLYATTGTSPTGFHDADLPASFLSR